MHRRLITSALVCLLAAGAVFVSARSHPAAAQGFFDRLFGPTPGGGLFSAPEPQRPVDSSRAPPPRKSETPPTTTILVMGDSMADWLAYGLEDALGDSPEIGIVRKPRTGSGLIRYDQRNEALEWAQGARDLLASEKPNYIVMMVGLNDRQPIRVRGAPARGTKTPTDKPQTPGQDPENPDQPAVTPEESALRAPGVFEFHSERWEELYTKRIDDTIAVLKSKGVPVFWVGLPSLRTPKATTEAQYLNELFRARAEKAGIVYVDVWDGFVDELGRFTLQGPDYEGQSRRLRAGDGIHFTKPGARKLAHYLEREINRVAPLTPVTVALPEQPQQTPTARPGGSTARPLNGPAVPLALYARQGEELIGTPSNRGEGTSQIAAHVLVKGDTIEAPAGRADDFAWPRRGIAAFGTDSAVTSTTMPVPLAQLPPPPDATLTPGKPGTVRQPGAATALAQPRPLPPQRSFNPFSFFGGLFGR